MFSIISMHDVAMHCPLIGDDNASRTQPASIFAYQTHSRNLRFCPFIYLITFPPREVGRHRLEDDCSTAAHSSGRLRWRPGVDASQRSGRAALNDDNPCILRRPDAATTGLSMRSSAAAT